MKNEVFLDANLLIYFLDKSSPFHKTAKKIFRKIKDESKIGSTSPFVINEVHYTCLKFLKNDPQIRAKIIRLLRNPLIKLTDFVLDLEDINNIFKISSHYKLKTTDAFHAYYCKKLKIKHVATLDPDFDNLPWLKVIK